MRRRYYFIRHAQPENEAASFRASALRRDMLGLANHPLSPKGRTQARALAPSLPLAGVTRIQSSGLLRARETASELSDVSGIAYRGVHEELNELAPGEIMSRGSRWAMAGLAGTRPRSVRRRLTPWVGGAITAWHLVEWRRGRTRGGDDLGATVERIRAMMAVFDRDEDERMAIVGHGYWIFLLAFHVAGGAPANLAKLRWIGHCHVTRIDADGRGNYRFAGMGGRLPPD